MSAQPLSPLRPVLYAEDDENDVFLMQRVFTKVGVANPLKIAGNGQDALDYLKPLVANGETTALPQLILLDLKMPRVTGLEALEQIRQIPQLAQVPVVILTSSIQDRDVRAARDLGATAYLVKAPSITALTDMVAELRNTFLAENNAPQSPLHLQGNRL